MPTLQICDFNHPAPQLPTRLSARTFPHEPTNFEVQLASVPTLQICDFNHPTTKPVEDLLRAPQDLMNIDNLLLAEMSIPMLQEGIPTIQVASAPRQLGLIMPQSEELNNNQVPVSSPNLPAPVKKRGRPAEKAMKAQIRDEQRKKQQRRSKD